MRYLLILGLALISASAFSQTYRWVDSSGKVIISDTPPPGQAKATQVDAPVANDNLPFAVKKAMQDHPVVFYSSSTCGDYCKQGRDLLNKRGVPFTEKSVEKQAELEELKQLIGDVFLPSIKVGKQNYRGFDAAAWNNLLDLAGYPKTAYYGSKPSVPTEATTK